MLVQLVRLVCQYLSTTSVIAYCSQMLLGSCNTGPISRAAVHMLDMAFLAIRISIFRVPLTQTTSSSIPALLVSHYLFPDHMAMLLISKTTAVARHSRLSRRWSVGYGMANDQRGIICQL
jgi:hypothetical protein